MPMKHSATSFAKCCSGKLYNAHLKTKTPALSWRLYMKSSVLKWNFNLHHEIHFLGVMPTIVKTHSWLARLFITKA